ncbi:MAG: aminopeptidase [Spirochaetales bacterium]|nr:aminopeptidase [Spirochaetales bacterium]
MQKDSRIDKMARIIARHALSVKPGEKVLIEATDDCDALIIAVIRSVNEVGGIPIVQHESLPVRRAWLMGATEGHLQTWYESSLSIRGDIQCLLSLRGQDNRSELADVPAETMRRYNNLTIKLGQAMRRPGFRKTVIRYPSKSLAQQCGMSTEAFADHFYRVCAMNFQRLHREMEPLKNAIDQAEEVRIVAPGTDLSFSIRDLQCSISAGTWNIPDGETAMQIVRDSVEGHITYNVPSSYQGYVFHGIRLTFSRGKIVNAEANDKPRIEAILDSDEGARYIGEFAVGVNPFLRRHMIDTLFDEKMAGSLHFTPGGTAADGTRSLVHWDIVQSHLKHYGGGEISLDGRLWRKDGEFVDEHMQGLNPDNLLQTLESLDSDYPDWLKPSVTEVSPL